MRSADEINHLIRSYGDLLFDLCESVLRNPTQVHATFSAILKKIRSGSRFQKFSSFERSWVLKVTCNQLLHLSNETSIPAVLDEQIKLNENEPIGLRLKHLGAYCRRLMPEDQILLLLRDKYGIPYPEIATALEIPEGSLKIRRQQALRTLEEWLWKSK